MTADELIVYISEGLKKPITKEDIFSNEIKIDHLKRIDRVFNKGIYFYLDPKSPEQSKDASIFFRKTEFGTELNIGTKKTVNQFEELKISLSAISKLAELEIKRIIPIYNIFNNPKKVAIELRSELFPIFKTNKKDFLEALIGKFANKNIFVFEYIETWNKKEKTNIDGFFLNPNTIVLKRQQNSFRREIFTLIHELGHYLLNEEEVEKIDYSNLANLKISKIERWCNDFAFYFLAGDYTKVIENLDYATGSNDYHFETIEQISKNTHLSKIAIFTRLLYNNKISQSSYNNIKIEFAEEKRLRDEEKNRRKELDKINGVKIRGSVPKPINSPLLISTIQTAFYEGVINEYDVCKTLNIKPNKLDLYIQ